MNIISVVLFQGSGVSRLQVVLDGLYCRAEYVLTASRFDLESMISFITLNDCSIHGPEKMLRQAFIIFPSPG